MIELEGVTRSFTRGGAPAVHEVDLHIGAGEIFGIIGRSGAGKSTLIRLMSGAEHPTRGHIYRDMSISWPLAFGGAFQTALTGIDNLRFICRIYEKRFEDVLPLVDDFAELGKYMREPLRIYSSGMRARLAFGISLAVDFDCFLIDEVIAVGDARFHEKCEIELFEKRKDRALIIVSHHIHQIQSHCQRACVLENGTLHSFADVGSALDRYAATV